jgi:hypothetical protein
LAQVLQFQRRNFDSTFMLLTEIGQSLRPGQLVNGVDVSTLLLKLECVSQDLKLALTSGNEYLFPSDEAKASLVILSGDPTVTPQPIRSVTSSSSSASSSSTLAKGKCGGSTTCKDDRAALMVRLQNAVTAREQIDLVTVMIAENRLFKRLWEKLAGNSDSITTGSLCGKCKPFYQNKIGMLRCLKYLCDGDLERMAKFHGRVAGQMKDGAFVMNNFKTLCTHGKIAESGYEVEE